jgi:uncharacterized membrane protein
VEVADLLGARALAWTGGIVTLLGVVFFFVLAVNQGWIGPEERVGLGAFASAAVLAGGVVLRRRYGDVYSALAAVGAGIAGAYATVLAAAALYGLVSDLVALALAAAIAAVGVRLALAWSAQMLAGLGLVGATLLPLSLVFEGGVERLGTAFAAIVLAATALVAVHREWRALLLAGLAAGVPQVILQVAKEDGTASASTLVLAAVFAGVLLATGLALNRRGGLDRLATGLVIGSATLFGGSAARLVDGQLAGADGLALTLLAAAGVYALLSGALFRVAGARDASALLVAVSLALGAVGLAELLTGAALAFAWAAQAAVLAWLGRRIGDTRYQAGALVYLVLAIGHSLAFGAHPEHFLSAGARPAEGVPQLVAAVAAAIVFVRCARSWPAVAGGGLVAGTLGAFTRLRETWRVAVAATAALLAGYAASLVVLAVAVNAGTTAAFDRGHVAVTAIWAAAGAALAVAGARRGARILFGAGLLLAGAAVAKLANYDFPSLAGDLAGWASFAVAVAFLAAGAVLTRARAAAREDERESGGTIAGLAFAAASAALGAVSAVALLPDSGTPNRLGLGLLAGAAPYVALATLRLRAGLRAPATLLWATSLAFSVPAVWLLLGSGTPRVAAYAGLAAFLAWLGAHAGERRLQLASAPVLVLALAETLIARAPPTLLFARGEVPEPGMITAVVLCAAALVALAAAAGRTEEPRVDELDAAVDDAAPQVRASLVAAAGVLAAFAGSLAVLAIAQEAGGAAAFDVGHVAVTAGWAGVGALFLVAAARRAARRLDLAGSALLGAALLKLGAWDLPVLVGDNGGWSALALALVCFVAAFLLTRPAAPTLIPRLELQLTAVSAGAAAIAVLVLIPYGGTPNRLGLGLLAAAVPYGVLAAVRLHAGLRAVSTVLWVVAIALALPTPWLLLDHGTPVVASLAAASVVLAFLAVRAGERRLQVAAAALLALALGQTLLDVAPPLLLFTTSGDPAAALPALLLSTGALLALGATRGRITVTRIGELDAAVDAAAHRLAPILLAGAAVLALDAVSLGVLALGEAWSGGTAAAYDLGHVAVTAGWALVGAVLLLARRMRGVRLEWFGTALAGAALVKLLAYDLGALGSDRGGWAALAVAAAYLASGSLLTGRRPPPPLPHLALLLTGTSAVLTAVAAAVLLPVGGTPNRLGLGLAAGAAPYAALAAARIRGRDRAAGTLLWVAALALAVPAAWLLLGPGTPVVAVFAGGAALLVWLGIVVRERRLQLAAATLGFLAVAETLAHITSPLRLFILAPDPERGIGALLLCVAALLAFVLRAGKVDAPARDATDAGVDEAARQGRPILITAAAVFALTAVSLGILALAQAAGGDATAAFQRGHTAISALWGLVGLATLYAGLRRRRAALKSAGFLLFGASLGKLFLYDLTTLSSITRALSFLAIGAVLLLAGFFYQRLSGQQEGDAVPSQAAPGGTA